MNTRLFRILIIAMTLALIGIIFVQGYWIKSNVENNEEQFSIAAKQMLVNVVNDIEDREINKYYFELASIADSTKPMTKQLSELFQVKKDDASSEYFVYSNSLIQEEYKISSQFLADEEDSVSFKKITSKKLATKISRNDSDEIDGLGLSAQERYQRINRIEDAERFLLLDVVKEMASQLPIHKRIDTTEVRRIIDSYISKLDINSDYEFGIFSNGLNTRVRSADFKLNSPSTYGIPVFKYNNNTSSYQLFINFQDKKKAILSSILLMAILSGSFTIIIVFVFATAINQLIKQRQISQIKSDFINNMTHEFKTPIATINLALDSVKNPKISEKPEMVARYLDMIREENKRMHAQVENVLRISKLEKNELDIKKEKASLHEIVDAAVKHVSLIVDDRGGYIKTNYGEKDCTILANNSHFVNVVVNILDNAIKYSPKPPKIDIFTEVVKNYIVLSVKDQGDGMSKTTQKKIFQKFYREHTGDVHNVKGHGLGLAYVKQIVEDHHGEVSVESEKNQGTTFIIKLPLIS